MTTELKYTILSFEEDARILHVQFDDGTVAHIGLTNPYPNTQDQLEAIIKHFAPTVEDLQAKTVPTNFEYIRQIVGVEQTTARHSRALADINPPDVTLAPGAPDLFVTTKEV